MRCVCGYPREVHELATEACPGLKTKRFSPAPAAALIDVRSARILANITMNIPDVERPVRRPAGAVELEQIARPPRVVARPPLIAGEFAGYGGRQAVGMGRKAMDARFEVVPLYWMAHDGREGCGIWMSRRNIRAVATWKRVAGQQGSAKGWGADVGYAWRTDEQRIPTKVSHTELERIFHGRAG